MFYSWEKWVRAQLKYPFSCILIHFKSWKILKNVDSHSLAGATIASCSRGKGAHLVWWCWSAAVFRWPTQKPLWTGDGHKCKALCHFWHSRLHKSVTQLVTAVKGKYWRKFYILPSHIMKIFATTNISSFSPVLKTNLIATWWGELFLIVHHRLENRKLEKRQVSFNTTIISKRALLWRALACTKPPLTVRTLLYLYWSTSNLQTHSLKGLWGYLLLW